MRPAIAYPRNRSHPLNRLRRLEELEKENERLRRAVSELTLDKQILKGERVHAIGSRACVRERTGKFLSPSRRRHCIDHVRGRLRISERRSCRVLGQHRSTQRHIPRRRDDEGRLVADMIEPACRNHIAYETGAGSPAAMTSLPDGTTTI